MKEELGMTFFNRKLSRDFLFNFGKGQLHVESSTLDLLLAITPFVDRDGRIYNNLDDVRKNIFQHRSTFKFALDYAIRLKYIEKKYDSLENKYYYYSNIHVNETSEKLSYMPHLRALSSEPFMNCTLNQKRLFCYFLAYGKLHQDRFIRLCNLYKNSVSSKSHHHADCLNFFYNLKDTLTALIRLSKNGLIQFTLNDRKSTENALFNSEDLLSIDSLEKSLNKLYFALNINKTAGERIKTDQLENIILRVTIPKKIANDEIHNIASKTEIDEALFKYAFIFPQVISADSKHMLMATKYELHKTFGEKGLTIYRAALKEFCKNEQFNILELDQNRKVNNLFVDKYIAPFIYTAIERTLQVIKSLNRVTPFSYDYFTSLLDDSKGVYVPLNKSIILMNFGFVFNKKTWDYLLKIASPNLLTTIEGDVRTILHQLNVQANKPYYANGEDLFFHTERGLNDLNTLYNKIHELFTEKVVRPFILNQHDAFMYLAENNENELYKLLYAYATDHLLTQPEKLSERIANDIFNRVQINTKKPPIFYNWLAERA